MAAKVYNSSVGDLANDNLDDLLVREFTPRSNRSTKNKSEHSVQFYEEDAFLLDSLCKFTVAGFKANETVIVVATENHRRELADLLVKAGVNIASALESGRYIPLDANEVLSKFMVEGLPQRRLFTKTVGSIIERAAKSGRSLRIFGEMVAILLSAGNREAAIRLEEFWNDLQKTLSFSLFCAYPINSFDGGKLAAVLGSVCAEHSRVIPSESYTEINDTDARRRAIIELQQKARSLEIEIEERKKIEDELRSVKNQLEFQLRMKDEFLATVSHELRTPLNAILGWSYVLNKGGQNEKTVARAIETIRQNAQAQARLVEDILDVSRVITGKLRLNIRTVDAAEIVKAAIACVQPAANSKNIRLAARLDSSVRHVAGDSNRLQQVVWNLLSNAIKFTPAGGRVEVRLARDGSDLKISVSDTGKGINSDFLPFIFDSFRQSDGSSTRGHGGLGLGLAIVRHLVELHGGTVTAESAGVDKGSTFTVRLPRTVVSEDSANQGQKTGNGQFDKDKTAFKSLPSLAGIKILLVDDNQDSLQMLKVLLSEYKAEAQAAASTNEAIEMLEWFQPDVLVSDLAMPFRDGYAIIRKIRESENGSRIPALALSAYARAEDRSRALAAGFDVFVPKPVEPDELIDAIANLAVKTKRF